MDRFDISFTDDELLQIISQPGYAAEIIFAEGYDLADAYPLPGEWGMEATFEMDVPVPATDWEPLLAAEGNWVIYQSTVTVPGKRPAFVSPVNARKDILSRMGQFSGLQAA